MERRVALGDPAFDPFALLDSSPQAVAREPRRGYYSRGYLPHIDIHAYQFITFRLNDSFPKALIQKLSAELSDLSESERRRETYRQTEAIVDSGHGNCWLRRPEVANIVEAQLLFHAEERYDLAAWTIMPNHVHLLARFREGYPLPKVVQSWKARSARRANVVLGRSGSFWYRDFFDRYIRDEEHFWNCLNYIDANPVKAGLCREPSQWQWGSARLQLDRNALPSATRRSTLA